MESLGLNPILLLAQLISFGVLFFVLKKFLYSNLRKSLEDRRKKIKSIETSNIEFDKKLVALDQQKVNLEKKNQEELRKLILEAQKSADEIKKEILEEADIRGKKMIEEATARIEQEKDKASEELKAEAGKLAGALATKILATPANSTKVIDTSIKELSKLGKSKK